MESSKPVSSKLCYSLRDSGWLPCTLKGQPAALPLLSMRSKAQEAVQTPQSRLPGMWGKEHPPWSCRQCQSPEAPLPQLLPLDSQGKRALLWPCCCTFPSIANVELICIISFEEKSRKQFQVFITSLCSGVQVLY